MDDEGGEGVDAKIVEVRDVGEVRVGCDDCVVDLTSLG